MGWAPLASNAPLDDPNGGVAAPTGFQPLAADAKLDGEAAAPQPAPAAAQQAPSLPGFSKDQQQAILAYIPKAKDAADLEQFSSDLTGGRAKIGNANDVLDARDKGAKGFAWEAPTAAKEAPEDAPHSDIRTAIGEGIIGSLDTMFPGIGALIRGNQGAGKAFTEHAANAAAGDYGPEAGGFLDTVAHPSQYGDFGTNLDRNVAHERAILEADSQGHGVASALGEVTGAGLVAPLAGSAVDGLAEVPSIAKAAAGGAVYGSGAAGPDHRVAGAVTGAALGAGTDLAAPYVIKAAKAGGSAIAGALSRAPSEDAVNAARAAQDLNVDLPAFAVQGPAAQAKAAKLSRQGAFGAKGLGQSAQTALDQAQAARDQIAASVGMPLGAPRITANDLKIHKSADGTSASIIVNHPETGNIVGSAILKSSDGKTVNVDSVIGAGGANSLGPAEVRQLIPLVRQAYPDAEYVTGTRITGARRSELNGLERQYEDGQISFDQLSAERQRIAGFSLKIPDDVQVVADKPSGLVQPRELDSSLGDNIKSSAIDQRGDNRARIGRMFTAGDAQMGGVPVKLQNTTKAVSDLAGEDSNSIVPSPATPLLKQIQQRIKDVGGAMSAADLRSSTQNLKALMRANAIDATTSDHVMGVVRDAMNADMETAAKTSGNESALQTYKDAREQWAASKILDKTVLKPVLGAAFQNNGDQVVNSIRNAVKNNGTRVAQLFNSLPDNVANTARASLINNMGTDKTGAFDLKQLADNWNSLGGSRKLVFPAETVQAMDKLANGIGQFAKPLQTVAQNAAKAQPFGLKKLMTSGPAALGEAAFMWTHDVKDLALGTAVSAFNALGQWRSAKLLANTDFAKRLANMPMNPKAAAAFWSRPWVNAMAAKNPAIAGEIQLFQHAVNDNLDDLIRRAAASGNSQPQGANKGGNGAKSQ